MGMFGYSPNEYTGIDRVAIHKGAHRVQICNVEQKFYKAPKTGFEITLKVSGYHGKLWYYLVIDPDHEKKTSRRLSNFFASFNITDRNLENYKTWIGKIGAVNVVHEVDLDGVYDSTIVARVLYCLSQKFQKELPPWEDAPKYEDLNYDSTFLAHYGNCLSTGKIWEFYRLILGLHYIDDGTYYFSHSDLIESIARKTSFLCSGPRYKFSSNGEKCSLDVAPTTFSSENYPWFFEQYEDYYLMKLLIELIDRNEVIAKRIATLLMYFDYDYTRKRIISEINDEQGICADSSKKVFFDESVSPGMLDAYKPKNRKPLLFSF